VVGWAMSSAIDQKLTLSALDMALAQRRPEPGFLHQTEVDPFWWTVFLSHIGLGFQPPFKVHRRLISER